MIGVVDLVLSVQFTLARGHVNRVCIVGGGGAGGDRPRDQQSDYMSFEIHGFPPSRKTHEEDYLHIYSCQ